MYTKKDKLDYNIKLNYQVCCSKLGSPKYFDNYWFKVLYALKFILESQKLCNNRLALEIIDYHKKVFKDC